jgi:putative transposase
MPRSLSAVYIHLIFSTKERFPYLKDDADFSVSASQLETVERYIENQKEHHRRVTYQDEVRTFLKEYSMEWDERYIWD